VIHGLVKRPLAFTLDALARYPMVSRMTFVECGGNSAPMFSKEPIQASVQALHGLASCAEWTGVRFPLCWRKLNRPKGEVACRRRRRLARFEPQRPTDQSPGRCDGRSLPEWGAAHARKRLSDAAAPPGWEGNMNVKFLRRLNWSKPRP